MRALLTLGLLAASSLARADDAVGIGAAVGAGGQGAATYGALELRLDAEWRGARLGLGARGVWLDGRFRGGDWDRAADAVTVLRLLELHTPGGTGALAAGALAPAQLAQVADGYRMALDDHPRTGVRGSVTTGAMALDLEIDDVLHPALAGGALAVQLVPAWGLRAAAAVDPVGTHAVTELGLARRWSAARARTELGGGLVFEPGSGGSAVVFAQVARDRGGARWSASADLRAGTGTVGGAFGPLYRLERRELWRHAESGAGAGVSASVAAPAGWLAASMRARPGLGFVGTLSAGAPMGRWLQAGAWAAASTRAAAGAAELRIAWARRMFSALQLARMYDTDAMQPTAQWSATAWFGATSD